jgi:hypothetical protein
MGHSKPEAFLMGLRSRTAKETTIEAGPIRLSPAIDRRAVPWVNSIGLSAESRTQRNAMYSFLFRIYHPVFLAAFRWILGNNAVTEDVTIQGAAGRGFTGRSWR